MAKHTVTGLRCDVCRKPVNQNQKRTKKGHAFPCNPTLPVINEGGY